ncbi:hypothetical protein, partial [Enterocloster asparagiformis]|uniref:hypothetical protein n=1 Tax=Enterocloster asparagiformis TaxID=333367 RepID=UPI001A99D5A0
KATRLFPAIEHTITDHCRKGGQIGQLGSRSTPPSIDHSSDITTVKGYASNHMDHVLMAIRGPFPKIIDVFQYLITPRRN